MADDK